MRLSEMVFINTDFERLFIERTLLVQSISKQLRRSSWKETRLGAFFSSIKKPPLN